MLYYTVEYEASHGTVSDLWHAHLKGEPTSMNPLGMVDALLCAMNHSADLTIKRATSDSMTRGHELEQAESIINFTRLLKAALHNTFRYGQGTRDMAGPTGLTTEAFIDKVAWRLGRYVVAHVDDILPKDLVIPSLKFRRNCKCSYILLLLLYIAIVLY